jgi:hypothetical protein
MINKPGLILFLAAILVAWFCIYLNSTPVNLDPSPSDTTFSVARAYRHLQQIAKAPHSTGTSDNIRVRSYIAATCRELGLDTTIQHTTALVAGRNGMVAANIYNIIARLKGTQSSKSVVVTAHYDSEPNAIGAGDDGAGCAAMLETARRLKAGRPLRNDVIFLFTDGEEQGLMGAHAFVDESPLIKEIGVALNFDARGSAGASLIAETNSANGWIVKEYACSGAHKNGSSLNYEIYKLLPNSTDYTPFKKAGIAGLNNAFIDGFVDYHSMTDKPENLDMNTFQEQGDNMLSLVRHFGNLDIGDTKAPDVTFFNVIGHWLVHYPASLNIVFLVLVNLILLGALVIGVVSGTIRGRGLLIGLLAFPIVLTIIYFLSDWTLQGIRAANPLYGGYYPNSYHSGHYYFALTGLGIAIFAGIYKWLLRKVPIESLLAGIVLLEVVVLDFLYRLMPTAIYFLCMPLLFSLIGCLILLTKKAGVRDGLWKTGLVSFCLLLPALLLLAPVLYSSFLIFDLQPTAAFVPAITGLLLGLALPLLAAAFRETRWLIPGGAFVLFVLTTLVAYLHRGHSPEQPMKTDLRYVINADEGKAYWVSHFTKTDDWNKSFFPHARIQPSLYTFPGQRVPAPNELMNEADMQSLPSPELTVQKDTVENGVRKLSLHCQAGAGMISVHMALDEKNSARDMVVDGKRAEQEPGKDAKYQVLDYRGVRAGGFDVRFELDPGKPFGLTVVSRAMGLPEIQGFRGYPPGIIPGPGQYSNTTMVVKHFTFRM